MTRELDSARRGAPKGQASSLVIFLHGYGANGADLLGLADPLAPHMPDTAFYAPDAPEACTYNPMGFQWFPIPWLDGSSHEAAERSMKAALGDVSAFLDKVLEDEGLEPENSILFGFSQGAMMSLHLAPRRSRPVAGVVGFSGRLLEPGRLQDEVVSKPPVLLVHGDADEVVPPRSLPEAADALTAAGFEVHTHVSTGVGHGIAPDGLSKAVAFMKDRLRV
ncbi:MAG: dienelactone hydrolase family protein [Pseudomonadota bacterium]